MRRLLLAVTASLALAGCIAIEVSEPDIALNVEEAVELGPVGTTARAALLATTGAQIGEATLTEGARGVLIRVDLTPGALTPGWHGAHFHAVGACHDHGAGFMASSGHLGRGEGIAHGLLNRAGPEAGDLPNIYAPEAGPIRAELFSPFVTLDTVERGGRLPLFDADGAALVIHANPDDHASQPIGGAGPRAACGLLERP